MEEEAEAEAAATEALSVGEEEGRCGSGMDKRGTTASQQGTLYEEAPMIEKRLAQEEYFSLEGCVDSYGIHQLEGSHMFGLFTDERMVCIF